jgi:hypothetical protein
MRDACSRLYGLVEAVGVESSCWRDAIEVDELRLGTTITTVC